MGYPQYSGNLSRSIPDSFGNAPSFSETVGSVIGQAMPISGSFHTTPNSASG